MARAEVCRCGHVRTDHYAERGECMFSTEAETWACGCHEYEPRAGVDVTELLASVCRKAWGERMNSPWSAWANEKLTTEERDALAAIGVTVDPGVSNVRLTNMDLDVAIDTSPGWQGMGIRES